MSEEKKAIPAVTVCFIEGRRGSACNNTAFSVVKTGDDGRPVLIDIIPAHQLSPYYNRCALTVLIAKAYDEALRRYSPGQLDEATEEARMLLGLH